MKFTNCQVQVEPVLHAYSSIISRYTQAYIVISEPVISVPITPRCVLPDTKSSSPHPAWESNQIEANTEKVEYCTS